MDKCLLFLVHRDDNLETLQVLMIICKVYMTTIVLKKTHGQKYRHNNISITRHSSKDMIDANNST